MKVSWLCAFLVTPLLVACGSSQPSTGSTGTTCAVDADRLIMQGAFEVRSRDLVAGPGNVAGSVANIAGTDAAGRLVVLRRAADQSEGQFTVPGTFDPSMYPNNVLFVRGHVSGEMFQEGFIAMGGQLTVTEVTPTFRATFHLESLLANTLVEGGSGGAPIGGAVDGCIAAPPAPAP